MSVKTVSSFWFHCPTAPPRPPQKGTAASKTPGRTWAVPAETKPPIERLEASAQRGVPTASSNRSRAAARLSMAAAMFQPVTVRVVPPTAYPRSVSSPVSGSSAARLAKSRSTTTTPFQRFGTTNRYGVPSASSPPVQVTPEGEPAGHGPVSPPPAAACRRGECRRSRHRHAHGDGPAYSS
ncbi:hypothetical protein [Streptomyces tendae]|uniref:hypothetical protein n=1 Tax=Streptomyces tendae TaxID=1932 RepID=UPI00370F861F